MDQMTYYYFLCSVMSFHSTQSPSYVTYDLRGIASTIQQIMIKKTSKNVAVFISEKSFNLLLCY